MRRFLWAFLALLIVSPALGQKIGFLGVGGNGDGVQSWNGRTGDVVPTFGDYLEALGGTGHNTYTLGDLLYSDGPDSLGILPIGVENSFLTISSGVPAWLTPTSLFATQLEVDAETLTNKVISPATLGGSIFGLNRDDTWSSGAISGGGIGPGTGAFEIDVEAGIGYVNDSGTVTRVTWSADTVTIPLNVVHDVFVDSAGVVQSAVNPVSPSDNIILGTIRSSGVVIEAITEHGVDLVQISDSFSRYAGDVLGPQSVGGNATTDAGSLQLNVEAGTFYLFDNFRAQAGASPITFRYWYRDGVGGWTSVASQTAIDPDFYDDGSGTLAALSPGEFKKDLLFVTSFTGGGGGTQFHALYGQETFADQNSAETGNNPAGPTNVNSLTLRLAGIVVDDGSTEIDSIVDQRPTLGQFSLGVTPVSDHGLLTGLTDDDHFQYLNRSGVRPMTGNLDMGAFLVDGVDVSDHDALHITAGANEVDGDQLDIDFTPIHYVPSTAPPEATNVDHLAAHLEGIDKDFVPRSTVQRIGWRLAPTSNGSIDLLGWHEQTDAAFALASATPLTVSTAGFHSHWNIVTTASVGLPYTLRVTGDSVDEVTGTISVADTEDIAVAADGSFQTTKSWIDASTISIVEASKSSTVDVFRTSYWDRGNSDFNVVGVRIEWTPDSPAWILNLDIHVVENDGSLSTLDSIAFANTDATLRALNGVSGKYKRGNYSTLVTGGDKSGLVIHISNQENIGSAYFEVQYTDET